MEEEIDDLDNYMLDLVDLMLEDRQGVRSDNFGKRESQNKGYQGNMTIIDQRTEDFT